MLPCWSGLLLQTDTHCDVVLGVLSYHSMPSLLCRGPLFERSSITSFFSGTRYQLPFSSVALQCNQLRMLLNTTMMGCNDGCRRIMESAIFLKFYGQPHDFGCYFCLSQRAATVILLQRWWFMHSSRVSCVLITSPARGTRKIERLGLSAFEICRLSPIVHCHIICCC